MLQEQMKALITTPNKPRSEAQNRLTAELREYFIAYFMRRYPSTKKITLKLYYSHRYTARVLYKGEAPNRTFFVRANTYEALVLKVAETYAYRGVPMAV